MANTNKIRGRIVEVFVTQERFADAIGVSQQTVTAKMNGRSNFSQEDIYKWSKALEIDQTEIGAYFFAD